ncbi:MAG: saccharopine dehydrogenase NADP-binding domain-containing protein [Pirellulaceae bacterium]|nr:saccharopine dehydrogenase NADP-binding domain-containing protein [Pirellulaceae bacterium]
MHVSAAARVPFSGRIVVLGCGSVAQCLLPLITRHLQMPADRILVIDMVDNRGRIASSLRHGVQYKQLQITPENYQQVLGQHLDRGDLLIDVAWNIETRTLLDWAHQRGVLYINTSVEEWDPYTKVDAEQTLYARQMKIRHLVQSWQQPDDGPTAVLDHGANPGLVSHLVKVALLEIAERIVADRPNDKRARRLRAAIDDQAFNQLAWLTGTRVIHISERDTQVTDRPKQPNEFVNTWSIEGFYEEGIAPAEMGWGTHEQALPAGARQHAHGPRNQIFLARRGMDTLVRSWVPGGPIQGMVIRHGEAFSISEYLTVTDSHDQVVYRPTVHYAYWPTDSAVASLYELRARDLRLQEELRILNDDITEGADILGCLLMGHDYGAWWIGSLLDIHESRRLVPGQNPTTLQVASSMLGAIVWMLQNPNRGVNLPDQLPHEEILAFARPYLGPVISKPVDWVPNPSLDASDPGQWQFSSFLIGAQQMTSQAQPTRIELPSETGSSSLSDAQQCPTSALVTNKPLTAGWS